MANFKIGGAEVPAAYFTAEQKKDHKFVERVAREYGRYLKARANWLEFVRGRGVPVFLEKIQGKEEEGDEIAAQGKGRTIYNIPRDRRVVIKQNAYIKMNDLAAQAKAIIDRLIKDCAENLPEDVQDLFGLLKSMFLEKKKMIYTPGIAAFVAMKGIKNPELLKAQDLLRQSMDAEIGKVYMYAQKKGKDGGWE